MIRASAAIWLNYATTLVFQVFFAAQFGTSTMAAAFVIAFAAAVSIGGVFTSTTLTIAVPRMLDPDGAIARPAAKLLGFIAALVVVTSSAVALGANALGSAFGPVVGVGADVMSSLIVSAAAFLAASALAGVAGSIVLARGRRFIPAFVPALPSTLGAAYLLLANSPTVTETFRAVAWGALLQMLVITAAVLWPRPRSVAAPRLQIGVIAILTVVQLLLFSMVPVLQRILAAIDDPSGAARFDYAARATQVAQQLLIGGLLLAILPDWAAVHRRSTRIGRRVLSATVVGAFVLTTGATIGLVAAPSLIQLAFQRGAFTAVDTAAVALVARVLLPGFVAEGLALILVQAMLATARNDLALGLGFFRVAVQALLTLLLGIAIGAVGVAVAYSVSSVLSLSYALFICARLGFLRGGAQLMLRSGVACALTVAAGAAATIAGPIVPPWLGATAVLSVAALTGFFLGLGMTLVSVIRDFTQIEDASPGAGIS
jgi:peptidoglycan biosynthesis protein MviN/MurJ (putative lipid II flippase)